MDVTPLLPLVSQQTTAECDLLIYFYRVGLGVKVNGETLLVVASLLMETRKNIEKTREWVFDAKVHFVKRLGYKLSWQESGF